MPVSSLDNIKKELDELLIPINKRVSDIEKQIGEFVKNMRVLIPENLRGSHAYKDTCIPWVEYADDCGKWKDEFMNWPNREEIIQAIELFWDYRRLQIRIQLLRADLDKEQDDDGAVMAADAYDDGSAESPPPPPPPERDDTDYVPTG